VLREQLRLAYLLAGRNKLTGDASAVEVGAETGSISALIGDELHLQPVAAPAEDQLPAVDHSEGDTAEEDHDLRRLEAIERTAGAPMATFRPSEEASVPEDEADAASEAARMRSRDGR
jgi:hypothetical protein